MLAVFLSILVRAGGAALVLYWWEPAFLVVYALVLAGVGVAMAVLRRPMKTMQRAVRRESDGVQAVQQDTLSNTLMVQTFLAYDSATTAWKDRLDSLRQAVYRQNRFSNVLHTGYGVLSDLGYLGCLLWFGAGVLDGRVSYGTLSAALQLVSQVQNPFGDMTQQLSSWFSFQTSAERLMDLDALPKESLRPDKWIRISLTKAGAPINEGSASAGACCAGGGAAEPLVLLQQGTELPFCLSASSPFPAVQQSNGKAAPEPQGRRGGLEVGQSS